MTNDSPNVYPWHVVVALVATDENLTESKGVYGTGFLLRGGVFVTCWHCIRGPLPKGQRWAAVRRRAEGGWDAAPLERVEQDPAGADLATARTAFLPGEGWPLYDGEPKMGMNIWSFGYPLPDPRTSDVGERQFAVHPRYLQGYIMRRFVYPHPVLGASPSYELQMPAPPGLSGAPIVLQGTDQILGVVYEEHVQTTTDDALNPHRFTFSLAYDLRVLQSLRGAATDGKPLGQYLLP